MQPLAAPRRARSRRDDGQTQGNSNGEETHRHQPQPGSAQGASLSRRPAQPHTGRPRRRPRRQPWRQGRGVPLRPRCRRRPRGAPRPRPPPHRRRPGDPRRGGPAQPAATSEHRDLTGVRCGLGAKVQAGPGCREPGRGSRPPQLRRRRAPPPAARPRTRPPSLPGPSRIRFRRQPLTLSPEAAPAPSPEPAPEPEPTPNQVQSWLLSPSTHQSRPRSPSAPASMWSRSPRRWPPSPRSAGSRTWSSA